MMQQDPDIKTDVELFKRDFKQLSSLIDKMDTVIDKLTEVSTGLNRILAVHDNRLSQQEDITKRIFELIESRRRETMDGMKEIKDKFDGVTDELKKGIDNIEKWRYYLIGMAIASGFLLSKITDIKAFFS